jgi:hypothetical protein
VPVIMVIAVGMALARAIGVLRPGLGCGFGPGFEPWAAWRAGRWLVFCRADGLGRFCWFAGICRVVFSGFGFRRDGADQPRDTITESLPVRSGLPAGGFLPGFARAGGFGERRAVCRGRGQQRFRGPGRPLGARLRIAGRGNPGRAVGRVEQRRGRGGRRLSGRRGLIGGVARRSRLSRLRVASVIEQRSAATTVSSVFG